MRGASEVRRKRQATLEYLLFLSLLVQASSDFLLRGKNGTRIQDSKECC
jgi:hypothetical protein